MADPITREQVERLRAAVRAYIDGGEPVSEHALCTAFDEAREPISGNEPDYVIDAWHESGFEPFHAALTRWRDELVAAETPRAAPDDTAPERLRERREALGWNQTWAAEDINRLHGFTEDPWGWRCVASCEEGSASAIDRTRYAAALSAAEAERMTAVGAWAKYGTWEASHLEPTSPPAPEVVDVPQPAPLPKTVAHFYTIRALPEPHRVSWNMPGDGPQWVRVNDALWLHVDDLRAMLADIDAQQGGAS